MAHSQSHSQNSLDEVNIKFNNLSNEVDLLKAEIAHQGKMRSLEWAIQNVEKYGCFEYKHKKTNSSSIYQSPEFVQSVLVWFRKGQGTIIDDNVYVSTNTYDHMEAPTETDKKEFRDKLSEQIFQLTGQQPCVLRKTDGRHAIHYCQPK